MIKKSTSEFRESPIVLYLYVRSSDILKNNEVSVYVMKWDKITANTPQRIYTTHFFFQFCDKTENERLFSAAKCVMTGNTLYVHYKGLKATVKYIMQQFFKKLGLKKKE